MEVFYIHRLFTTYQQGISSTMSNISTYPYYLKWGYNLETPNYMKLNVWNNSKDLAVEIYKLTMDGELSRDFGLKDQIRRAAVSIASNIAEGSEKSSSKDYVRYLNIAKGSIAELLTQLIIAKEIGYINEQQYRMFYEKYTEIMKMLVGLIKSKSKLE
ncbi:four helix bundle protein [Lutispora saccharofermentans]|uniref:Four helix bundle protein n=1 Tax=Lutispora saccharofermentans TaxID=3024236 RepID=A0ABT1ND37_9FIRM|nr:four helix bundle protein [Lutispora saccharofermentans]